MDKLPVAKPPYGTLDLMVLKTLHTLGPQHVTALRAFLWRLTGRGRTAAELDSEIAAGSIAFPVL